MSQRRSYEGKLTDFSGGKIKNVFSTTNSEKIIKEYIKIGTVALSFVSFHDCMLFVRATKITDNLSVLFSS